MTNKELFDNFEKSKNSEKRLETYKSYINKSITFVMKTKYSLAHVVEDNNNFEEIFDRVDEAYYKEDDLYKVMNCENELKVYYNSYYQNESAELFEEHEEKRKEEYLQVGGLVKELNDFADNKN